MGCGCNAKKEVEKAEYNAESEETLCGQGKDSYAQKESALYDTFISLSMGAIGYFVTTTFKVKSPYNKAGIILASVLMGNVASKTMNLGTRIAGMRFDTKCNGGE